MDALTQGQGKSPLYKLLRALFVLQDASKVRKMIEEQNFGLLHEVNCDERDGQSEYKSNFWMLCGDPCISEFEARIADAFTHHQDIGKIKTA